MAIKEKIKEVKEKTKTKVKEVSDKAKDFYEEHKGSIMFAAGYAVAGGIAILAERALYGTEHVVRLESAENHMTCLDIGHDEDNDCDYAYMFKPDGVIVTNLGRRIPVSGIGMGITLDDEVKEYIEKQLSNLPE